MNVAQQILNVILKMMYYDDFKNSMTSEEKDFIQSIRISSIKIFRLSSLHDRRTILTWLSSTNITVACVASDDGFHFSELEVYKSSTKGMKGLVQDIVKDGAEREIIEEEVEELKKTFRVFCKDVDVYFK